VKSKKFSKADKHFSDIYTSFQGRNLNLAINCLEGMNKLPNKFNFSFILIIFGTTISLIPTNQLWILVNKESQKLSIGGLSNKNLVGFKKEFFKLSDEIKDF